MKVLFDHQIFSLQKYGGISRYFYELFCQFNEMDDITYKVPIIVSNNHYISNKETTKHIDIFSNLQFKGKGRLFSSVNRLNSIINISQKNYDVFHPTYYDPYFIKYLNKKPFVLTVHDMIHEKFNNMFSKNNKTSEQKRYLVEKADKVIAISQNTKKDIIDILKVDESKIEVIYHGNSMIFVEFERPNILIPENYILFVGNRSGYKNFERFIRSISEIIKKEKDLFVICAGGGNFNNYEIELFQNLKIENKILQYNLEDKTLLYLYKNALMFVYPSLYEGFGIPILESFSCGCPLICSNSSSFPEVAGDAAIYFDPYSEESIRESIKKVLLDKNLRKTMVIKGYEQVKKFSWKETAIKTKELYNSLII